VTREIQPFDTFMNISGRPSRPDRFFWALRLSTPARAERRVSSAVAHASEPALAHPVSFACPPEHGQPLARPKEPRQMRLQPGSVG
jgi:hypothetical protein